MAIFGREFLAETEPDFVVNTLPYLKDRFDALAEIRKTEYENALICNMGRRFAKQGVLGRRIASIPGPIATYWKNTFGQPICMMTKEFKIWLKLAQNAPYRAS